MTLEACYQEIGGDYQDVRTRLPSATLIQRFVVRFLDDPNFEILCREMEAGNREPAFRAAHTMKGVCANLSFARLQSSVGALTEVLRREQDTVPAEAAPLMEQVRKDYQLTADTIRRFRDGL